MPGAAIDHWFDRVCEQPIETGYYLARRKLLATRGEVIEPLPVVEVYRCQRCGEPYLTRQARAAHEFQRHGIIGPRGMEKRARVERAKLVKRLDLR